MVTESRVICLNTHIVDPEQHASELCASTYTLSEQFKGELEIGNLSG